MIIWCCGCHRDVNARLTSGGELYPRRSDLSKIPFWVCDSCGCFVGCHHKTSKPTTPLGVLATKQIKAARVHIHNLIDPTWKSGKVSRGKLYKAISKKLGYQYHTGEIRTIEEARKVYSIAREIIKSESWA